MRKSLREGYARWYIAYFLLASFDILTVSGSLVLNHQLMNAYRQSAEVNRLWAARLETYIDLQNLIATANAPGNDVFASRDPGAERLRHRTAMTAFEQRLHAALTATSAEPAKEALPMLAEVDRLMSDMSKTTEEILSLVAQGDISDAGTRMAGMDQIFAQVNVIMNHLVTVSQIQQRQSLQEQLELAEGMRSIEYVIGALIAVMVIGVAIYGYRLSRQMAAHEREREQQIAAIEASEQRFRELAEGSIEGIVVHRDGRPLFVNRSWADIHGIADPVGTLPRLRLLDLVEPADRPLVAASATALLDGLEQDRRYEYRARKADGTSLWLECLEHVVAWAGHPALQSTVIDITERKRAEAGLREALLLAEQATNARTRFFTAASHDLRQPLHAISLYLPLIEKRIDNPETSTMLGSVRNSCVAMRGILDSLLDISKLDAGIIQPNISAVSAADLIDQLAMEFMPQAADKGIELRVVPAGGQILSDPALLERILRNLLSNALRYTRQGKVLLGLRRAGDRVRLEVWDTGPGIAEADQARIFEEFFQADNPERDRGKGLGLGLAIIDRLAHLLDHRVSFRSWPGHGSVFRVEVPLAAEDTARRPARALPASDALAGKLALLIDDDEQIRTGTGAVLAEWGIAVLSADSIAQALRRIDEAGRAPDIVLADYRLRDTETGVQAIEAVRRKLGRKVPGIVITGEIGAARLREVIASDFAILHKPMDANDLARGIDDALAGENNDSMRTMHA